MSASDSSETDEQKEQPTEQEVQDKLRRQAERQERQKAIGVLRRDGDKLYRRKNVKQAWRYSEIAQQDDIFLN